MKKRRVTLVGICNVFRDDNYNTSNETRYMATSKTESSALLGARLRYLREARGWSQEKVGVEVGLDESSARARISRYELGVHEPPIATARMLAKVLNVPLAYLYCEDDQTASLLLVLQQMTDKQRRLSITRLLKEHE